VQVNALENLQHALLYSIQVELPAHRLGQLDRVLVLASPLNDMAIHAWDLNRVQRFFQLDIGVRLEMCSSCLRGGQERSITFVMDQRFIGSCVKFLCREARIALNPINQNGFKVYNFSHICYHPACFEGPEKDRKPLPPPYPSEEVKEASSSAWERAVQHEYDYPENPALQSEATTNKNISSSSEGNSSSMSVPSSYTLLQPYFQFPEGVWEDYSGSKENGDSTTGKPTGMTEAENTLASLSVPAQLPSEVGRESRPSLSSTSSSVTSLGESLFLADGILSSLEAARGMGVATLAKDDQIPLSDVPPRNIPRVGGSTGESSPNLHYYNFQPHLHPQHHNVHMKSIPIPPRGLRPPRSEPQDSSQVSNSCFMRPLPPRRTTKLPDAQSNVFSSTAPSPDEEAGQLNTSKSLTDLLTQRTLESSERESYKSSATTNLQSSRTFGRSEGLASPPSANVPIKSKADDDNEPDYEYMSDYSIRSQLGATLSFSLVALDLNSSQDKCHAYPRANVGKKPSRPYHSMFSEPDRSGSSLQRTFSDSSLDLSFSEPSLRKQSPLELHPHAWMRDSVVSSTSSFEEDCYVMIPPAAHRTRSERSISPSYIRDAELLDRDASKTDANQADNTSKAATSLSQYPLPNKISRSEVLPAAAKSKTVPRKDRKISLSDAGNVIREDWLTTLDDLRKEHAKITRQVQQVVRAQTGDEKLNLNQIAYLDWRNTEKAPGLTDSFSGTDSVFPLVDDNEENASLEEPEYSDFVKPHSKSEPAGITSSLSPNSMSEFRPRSRQSLSRNQTIPRSSAVVNRPPAAKLRNQTSSGYIRSISLPKSTTNLHNGGASSSNFTVKEEVEHPLPNSRMQFDASRSSIRRSSSTESEEDMEYVHEFINVMSNSRLKPVPPPRLRPPQQQKFDSSQQASMVTLGIFRDASSPEGNLLKALGKSNSAVPSSLLSRGLPASSNTLV